MAVSVLLPVIFSIGVAKDLHAHSSSFASQGFSQISPHSKSRGVFLIQAPTLPQYKHKTVDSLAEAYLALGKKLYYANQFDESVAALERALDRQPNFAEAHLILGGVLLSQESYNAAVESFTKAIKYATSSTKEDISIKAEAYRGLGMVDRHRKKYQQAETNLKTALKLRPKHADTQNSLAYLYSVTGNNLNEALALINAAITGVPSRALVLHYYLDTRAWIYYRLGRYKDAEDNALESTVIAQKHPKDVEKSSLKESYYHLGEIFLAQNKSQLAKQAFQKALTLDMNYTDALEGLRKVR